MLRTAGIVLLVKSLSLKHNVPPSRDVVFETYTENPKNLEV